MLKRRLFSNLVRSSEGFSVDVRFPHEIIYEDELGRVSMFFERLLAGDEVTLALDRSGPRVDSLDGPALADGERKTRILERVLAATNYMKLRLVFD